MMEDSTASTYTVTVSDGKGGQRLDRFLAGELPDFSRSRLKVLIEDGCVLRRDGESEEAVHDPSRSVRAGQCYAVQAPPTVPAAPLAQSIPLDIVYEDDDVIVIDKPAGMVVHPAPGSPDGTLVNALLGHARATGGGGLSGIGGVERPGIVHRLDKGTSGLMVVAKNDASHRCLSELFAERSIERAYHALVWGVPRPSQGEIRGNIGRSPVNRKKMAVVTKGGKEALTRFKVVRRFASHAALVECRLATGRTHQIRVHMASIGHPVVGDPLYGGGGKARRRGLGEEAMAMLARVDHQILHAYLLGFRATEDGDMISFKSKLPQYFKDLIEKFE